MLEAVYEVAPGQIEAGAVARPRSAEGEGYENLIVGLNYAPELTGVGKYTAEMAEALVTEGHDVRVVCAPPYYPQWRIAEGFSAWRYRLEYVAAYPSCGYRSGCPLVLRAFRACCISPAFR